MTNVRAEWTRARTRLSESSAGLIEARTRVIEARAYWLRVRDRVDNSPDRTGIEDIPVRAAHWLEQLEWGLAKLDSIQAEQVEMRRQLVEIDRQLTVWSN
jgi:hypothetical protein